MPELEQKRITLYAAAVRLALEEAGAVYDVVWIDLMNKPEWYEREINPDGKVPVLVYGGPKVHPGEALSADAVKLTESVVILEFLADIFPDAHLLPADPVLRARARLFNAAIEPKLFKPFTDFMYLGGPLEAFLAGLEELQGMLCPTGFIAGEWSIADAAFSPILARIMLALTSDLGTFVSEAAKEALQAFESPRFARLRQYYRAVMARPSMLEEEIRQTTIRRIDRFRKTGVLNNEFRIPVQSV
ncbi:hypothetical protein BN946_scf184926.g11 [Trametes cinnabarina]|uniref:GST N-terminal domain-containing protein n=1 Tax=Pycnoporus cinnabarinus TaxID=5643 RepID=A0A060SZ75_PYCCI|nr:hypothetical protein BN946_scf184926.g11 [Trametes cinnabarina]